MKKLTLLTSILLTSLSYANCDLEAIEAVSTMTSIKKDSFSVVSRIQDDLEFYTFVVDKTDDSLVYEVKLDADSMCWVRGYCEIPMSLKEFKKSDPKEASIFFRARR